MYYSDEIIEDIRSRNDIIDVISGYVRLSKKGNSYFGLCPFHNEKSPSFSVSPGKQMYYCFGCGAGGNVFTFIMEYENYTFTEALKLLAERSGVALPELEETAEQKKQNSQKKLMLDINREAAKFYYYQLSQPQGEYARTYLEDRRLSRETITHFGLGYSTKFGNNLYKYLKKLNYDDYILKESGLLTFDEKKGVYDKFWNRVIFPIMDVNNRVVGFGGRVMGDGTPKYLNSPETRIFDKSRNLYGLNLARISRRPNMIICEGYMDVLSLHQAGLNNAVASLGTAFTSPQASLLKRYTNEVLLAYDSDGAGVKAALRAIPILKEAGLRARVISMQPYKDPDEFIKNLGVKAFEERMENAQNSVLFEISVLESSYELNDPEGKTEFYNQVARRLLEFTQELERNNYIEAVARRYGIAFEDLKKLVNRYGASLGYGEGQAGYNRPARSEPRQSYNEKEDALLVSQKLLLTWLVEDTSLFPKILPYISPEDFRTPIYHQVAQKVFDEYAQSKSVTPAKILNQFEDKEEQTLAAALFNTNIKDESDKPTKEKALNETIKKIKTSTLEEKSRHAQDMQTLQEIIRLKADIQKLHISL